MELSENRLGCFPVIYPWSVDSIGTELAASFCKMTSLATSTIGIFNEAILIPFSLALPVTIRTAFTYNGASVGGTLDIGVYTREGGVANTLVRMFSSGPTVQSGTNAIQSNYVLSGTMQIGPGTYYMALLASNGSAGLYGINATAVIRQGYGMRLGNIGAATLPATITSFDDANLPSTMTMWGIATRSFI